MVFVSFFKVERLTDNLSTLPDYFFKRLLSILHLIVYESTNLVIDYRFMNKSTSLWIAYLPIFIGILASIPVQASSVLVNNSRPHSCEFRRNGKLQENCSTFKLTRVLIDEKNQTTGFLVDFFFKDSQISYLVTEKNFRRVNIYGKQHNAYLLLGKRTEQRGLKPTISKVVGGCIMAFDYSEVMCSETDSGFYYSYEANSPDTNFSR